MTSETAFSLLLHSLRCSFDLKSNVSVSLARDGFGGWNISFVKPPSTLVLKCGQLNKEDVNEDIFFFVCFGLKRNQCAKLQNVQ